MRWKQFFTPVKSVTSQEALKLLQNDKSIGLLDVRQPGEYQQGHIAGAQLIPLPNLGDSLDQLHKATTLIVYCAIGGRSRVAAQQLAGHGFAKIYNLSGGYKAWTGHAAYGTIEQGTELFTNLASPEEVLLTAYSLEEGLKDFYLQMIKKVALLDAVDLFQKLAHIEDLHKDRIFDEYQRMTDDHDRRGFEDRMRKEAMEGGMSTDEYLSKFHVDENNVSEIIGLAMSIEAQALDLYSRSALLSQDPKNKTLLEHIADEEKEHLKKLGFLLENLLEENHG